MVGICVPVVHVPNNNNYPLPNNDDYWQIKVLQREIDKLKKQFGGSSKEGCESTAQEEKKESVENFVIDGITVHSVPSKKAQVESIFETLTKIPTGRKTLEELKQNKTEVYFEKLNNVFASYSEPNNAITVNSSYKQGHQEYGLIIRTLEKDSDKEFEKLRTGKDLDYASQLMVERAEYASDCARRVKICDELDSVGHSEASRTFDNGNEEFAAYRRTHSLSDVFKVAYTKVGINAEIELDLMKKACRNFEYLLDTQYTFAAPVSLTPADVAKACNSDQIDGYEEFMNSAQARRVQPLTKKVLELYNAASVARGASNDPSLDSLTVQSLNGSRVRALAQNNIKKMGEFFENLDYENRGRDKEKDPEKDISRKIARKMLKSVEKINNASSKGKTNKMAELRTEALKRRMTKALRTPEAERQDANNNLAQIAAIKHYRGR